MNAVLPSSMPMPESSPGHSPANPALRRYLALWLPFLSADRLRCPAAAPDNGDLPQVLVEKQGGALRLAGLDAVAVKAGLSPGMTLAQARAIVPALGVADLDRVGDQAALIRAAEATMRFTPLVALDGVDGLMLDITGCAHLFGSETGLLQGARRLMASLGLTVRAALATTPEAAHAFARFPGAKACAQRLPVQALEAGEETTRALLRAGLRTLGDLADRPSHALTARFGEEVAGRLACLLGREDRRITPLRPPPEIIAERHFPEPLAALDDLLRVLERLARNVAACLESRGEGGRVFAASFFRSDGAVRQIDIRTAQGTRDAQSLMRLLRLRIEALADPLDPGFGFDAVRLAVLAGEPMGLRQDALVAGGSEAGQERAVADLVDRLMARFGAENVRRFVARDTHDPARLSATVRYDSARQSMAMPEPDDAPARPITLFARPQPVEATAEVPDGPPLRFRWRRVLHEVTRAEGPERIAPEWWRSGDTFPAIRDYYRVENAQGHRFWLFREGFYGADTPVRWYIHGLFA